MKAILGFAVLVMSLGLAAIVVSPPADPEVWTTVKVPAVWKDADDAAVAKHEGFAWYRCVVKVPDGWKGKDVELIFQRIEEADEAFFNGEKIGATGTMPPKFEGDALSERRYKIEGKLVQPGEYNLIAVRVYAKGGLGGVRGTFHVLRCGKEAIQLTGTWQFRRGDDMTWAKMPDGDARAKLVQEHLAVAKPPVGSRGVEDYETVRERAKLLTENVEGAKGLEDALRNLHAPLAGTDPVSPAESLKKFKVQDGYAVDLVAAEPIVRQPLYMTFDERGRMWVVQYIQYPFPAGLKVVSYDQYIRAQFDKVPLPPPNHVRGLDKITILEDTKGNGTFDRVKTFAQGLNITTAVLPGRGGVWVLNPPYLLFYRDKDRTDIAEEKPEVHLSGFGLEDTHSVANSLAWGPDGWIYGAQGSTCTAKVKVEITGEKKTTDFLGQAIWRYQPETHQFEVFAEGGGNTFGLEIDDKGRVYSGTNGGQWRGVEYVQGGYYVKAWGKHGPLTNPYALGYFEHMPHSGNTERFTHNLILYGGDALPGLRGKLLGVNPLQRRVQVNKLEAAGSYFKTTEEPFLLTSSDGWFRPIDIKAGPDGAIYFTDFYENRISHVDPRDNWDRTTGRIYRIRAANYKPATPIDMTKLSGKELIDQLRVQDRWHRQTALRVLGDRKDRSLIPELRKHVEQNTGQFALEALWALHLCGGLDAEAALKTLDHEDAEVRRWCVRLLGDEKTVSPEVAAKLAVLAKKEADVHVRGQLASSAKRLPGRDALPIIAALLRHDEDRTDAHLPLLVWWALESKAETDRDSVLSLFRNESLWLRPLVEQTVIERLAQRYGMAGGRDNLLACAELLRLAPKPEQVQKVLTGIDKAFAGRAVGQIPDELRDAVLKAWSSTGSDANLSLGLRMGQPNAVERSLKLAADEMADPARRLEIIRVFGEVDQPKCVSVLLDTLKATPSAPVKREVLGALQRYNDVDVPTRVLEMYADQLTDKDGMRSSANALLVSRPAWALQFLEAIDAGKINPRTVPLDVVRSLKLHSEPRIAKLVEKHWGQVRSSTSAEKQQEMARLANALKVGTGDAKAGKEIFTTTCAKCHKLFDEGGTVGPDLTGYERDKAIYWIENIVDPSAVIREEYTTFVIQTKDGRTLTGIITEQDKQTVTLKTPEGETKRVAREKIDDLKASPISIMPEDQMRALTDQQIRDLFAYLMAKKPGG
jgi:putative membrane-bound dehydrogenase-like protein